MGRIWIGPEGDEWEVRETCLPPNDYTHEVLHTGTYEQCLDFEEELRQQAEQAAAHAERPL